MTASGQNRPPSCTCELVARARVCHHRESRAPAALLAPLLGSSLRATVWCGQSAPPGGRGREVACQAPRLGPVVARSRRPPPRRRPLGLNRVHRQDAREGPEPSGKTQVPRPGEGALKPTAFAAYIRTPEA